MKVIYIIGGSGKRFGSEIVAMSLMEKLSRDYGVEFLVVVDLEAVEGCVADFCREKNIQYIAAPIKDWVYYPSNNKILRFVKKNVRLFQAQMAEHFAVKQLESKVDVSKYDLIHTNLSRNLLGARLSQKYGVPHVWHLQELSRLHYGLDYLSANQIEYMNCNSTSFVAISEYVRKAWISEGLKSKKLKTVWNGIETDKYKKKCINEGTDKIRIVMVGYLSKLKGQDQLIKALGAMDVSERENFVVDFIGSGTESYIAEIKRIITEYGLEHYVHLKGYSDNVSSILGNYDVGIICSKAEGFGLVTVEYMASGLCTIASDTGCNPYIIEDGKDGILYRYNDYNDLKSKLLMIRNNTGLINDISKEAIKHARERFDIKRMATEIFQIYKDAIYHD